MLDFLMISTRSPKKDVWEIYPKFIIKKSSDLMIRGGDFYAVWDEERGLWSTDEHDVIRLVDRELKKFAEENADKFEGVVKIMYMWDSDSGSIRRWHSYCQNDMRDSYHALDENLIFSNHETKKEDYASRALSYPLEAGDISAWDKLVGTLYSNSERHKIEWIIGAIVTGDSKNIQKFMVLYGGPGTGKSTILNIISQIFDGYCSVFDAKALGSTSNSFALEAFRNNPLVAIQHDGDLSRIEDNTRLNSLVSHELMMVNEKFKSTYATRFNAFLLMGTNKPVKITDGKSGLLRRLIDVSPSGNKLNRREYKQAVKQVGFELGAIAHHCKEVYLSNPGYYDTYIPVSMLGASNDFYNFVLDSYHVFKAEDGTTLKAAWEMYKTYCEEAKVPYPHSQRIFKEELKNYFWDYKDRFNFDDGSRVRSYYTGFRTDQFEPSDVEEEVIKPMLINFNSTTSIFDKECADCFAQYATTKETPSKKWENVKSKLSELNTSKVHYVKVPENHIVIDFDIPAADGTKSLDRNVEEASKWPPTYAELSKSGAGVHLHYIYSGDPTLLSRVYDDHIEVKVFTGKSSLRRKLTVCNDLPIATISSGLPLKGDTKMVNFDAIQSEKGLRTLIKKNLNKEIHPATKPSIDFIKYLLDKAYDDGLKYDVTDMRNAVLSFATGSSNQAEYCIKLVTQMKFKSDDPSAAGEHTEDTPIVFYDVEVFPNLFLVNWKIAGEGKPVVRMINPKPAEIEQLLKFRLVGFNCRRYDNHILYARLMGYTNEQLFNLSQKIVGSKKGANKDCFFSEAYNISYTDVYDFASAGNKQSLKKWEIELGIHHQELGLPWDQPVPEEMWPKVAEYCDNDVIATEAVFNHLKADWTARLILADVAGLTPNDTTNTLTGRIIFGSDKKPQGQFNYRNLGEPIKQLGASTHNFLYNNKIIPMMFDKESYLPYFPGYTFDRGTSIYMEEEVGEGGYVYAEPGMYGNVALLDIASMHPSSAIAECLFGPKYTARFKEIKDARVCIKHGDYDAAKKMLDGKLAKYLDDKATAKDLANALKTAINSVYGLTSAGFPNLFKDPRNNDNIVAKRGALFMVNLKKEVQAKGFTVAHIKTDSIKIPDATPEIIEFVKEYGKKYGYDFEHEATYEKMCLVNNAVYIAKYAGVKECEEMYGYIPDDNAKKPGKWTATGKEFAVPYIFKKLFSKEEILFDDLTVTMAVTTSLHLDLNETLANGEHDYKFVGKVGNFCPIKPGKGGGILLREGVDKDGNLKYSAPPGSLRKDKTPWRWLEAEMVYSFKNYRENIDTEYFDIMVDDAVESISKFGDFEWFVSDDPYEGSFLQASSLCPF